MAKHGLQNSPYLKRKAGLEERKRVLVGFECLLSMGSGGCLQVQEIIRMGGWVAGMRRAELFPVGRR